MKTRIIILTLVLTNFIFAKAQMDDKFYFPGQTMEPIEWKNSEELNFAIENDSINVLILKPNKKAKATVFYFHGAGGNLTTYAPLMTPLLKDNFQVVLIDFRGYGKSTGIPTHKNIASDGEFIFAELSKKGGIKNTKKIIYGASIGTQIATHLAKNHQNEISGLVLEGGMFSFGHIAAVHAPQFKDYLENSFVTPYAAKEDIVQINKIPKLIIHSKEDKDVPYAQGILLFENALEPKEFLEFSGEHLMAFEHIPEKILEKMNRMISEQ